MWDSTMLERALEEEVSALAFQLRGQLSLLKHQLEMDFSDLVLRALPPGAPTSCYLRLLMMNQADPLFPRHLICPALFACPSLHLATAPSSFYLRLPYAYDVLLCPTLLRSLSISRLFQLDELERVVTTLGMDRLTEE